MGVLSEETSGRNSPMEQVFDAARNSRDPNK